jgi:hypothetical protein
VRYTPAQQKNKLILPDHRARDASSRIVAWYSKHRAPHSRFHWSFVNLRLSLSLRIDAQLRGVERNAKDFLHVTR